MRGATAWWAAILVVVLAAAPCEAQQPPPAGHPADQPAGARTEPPAPTRAEDSAAEEALLPAWPYPRLFGFAIANPIMAMIWAGIAQGKGRSGLVWGLLSLVFPILSWAILLLLKPAPRVLAAQ